MNMMPSGTIKNSNSHPIDGTPKARNEIGFRLKLSKSTIARNNHGQHNAGHKLMRVDIAYSETTALEC